MAANIAAAAVPNFGAGDITAAHVTGSFSGPDGKFDAGYFTENIVPVLIAERRSIKASIPEGRHAHEFDCTQFTNVYVTSDLHADYRKFLDILSRTGLIRLPGGLNLYNDDIYDPRIITETTWNVDNACLIILGDIVDGKRSPEQQVDDPRGQFESLIHMFLYNLRRRAVLRDSMVAFTIGNHDYHALFDLTTDPNVNYFWNNYVHDTARTVYSTIQRRYDALRFFYEVMPLFYVSIIYPALDNRKEMVGIHAGFHAKTGVNITNHIKLAQTKANLLSADTSLNSISIQDRIGLYEQGTENGGIWTRVYENPAVCAALIEKADSPILTVVGHCPTIYHDAAKLHSITKNGDARYIGCMGRTGEKYGTDNTGCVVLSCNNRLAHVDVSMSQSFFPKDHDTYGGEFNQNADKEVLRLQHDPTLSVVNRYYNIVERFNGFFPAKTHIMFRAPPAPPAPAGGANNFLRHLYPEIVRSPKGGAKKRRLTKRRKLKRAANTRRRSHNRRR